MLTAIVEAGLTINPRHILACAVLNRNVSDPLDAHVMGRRCEKAFAQFLSGAVERIDPGLEVHWIEVAEI